MSNSFNLLKRRGMTAKHLGKAIALYDQGWSLARIAVQLEVDDSTVHRRLRAAGVAMRDTQGRPAGVAFGSRSWPLDQLRFPL